MNLAGAGLAGVVGRRRYAPGQTGAKAPAGRPATGGEFRRPPALLGSPACSACATAARFGLGARQERGAHHACPDCVALRRHVQSVDLENVFWFAGRQSELMQKAFSNTAPSRPMRSIWGVRRSLLPASEDSSQRAPSPRKKMRFGRALVAVRPGAAASSGAASAAAPATLAACRKSRRVRGGIRSVVTQQRADGSESQAHHDPYPDLPVARELAPAAHSEIARRVAFSWTTEVIAAHGW